TDGRRRDPAGWGASHQVAAHRSNGLAHPPTGRGGRRGEPVIAVTGSPPPEWAVHARLPPRVRPGGEARRGTPSAKTGKPVVRDPFGVGRSAIAPRARA